MDQDDEKRPFWGPNVGILWHLALNVAIGTGVYYLFAKDIGDMFGASVTALLQQWG